MYIYPEKGVANAPKKKSKRRKGGSILSTYPTALQNAFKNKLRILSANVNSEFLIAVGTNNERMTCPLTTTTAFCTGYTKTDTS